MRGDAPDGDDQPDLDRPSPARGGPSARGLLIAALVMIVVGYVLVTKLRDMSRMQDCLMSGRTNCAPIAGTER